MTLVSTFPEEVILRSVEFLRVYLLGIVEEVSFGEKPGV